MKKAINWFLCGTHIWHALLAIISFSVYAMTGQNISFFLILGVFFILMFATSLTYTILVENKESKELKKKSKK